MDKTLWLTFLSHPVYVGVEIYGCVMSVSEQCFESITTVDVIRCNGV